MGQPGLCGWSGGGRGEVVGRLGGGCLDWEAVLVSDFHFDLPEELIAQHPPVERGASRMLVLERDTGAV